MANASVTHLLERRAVNERDRVAVQRGPIRRSCVATTDLNWPCSAMADWADDSVRAALHPVWREPWRSGYVESFNFRIRDECLNVNSFLSLGPGPRGISDWKADYNHRRRQSSLGLPSTSQLCCRLYPPMNDSRSPWTTSKNLLRLHHSLPWDGRHDSQQPCKPDHGNRHLDSRVKR